MDCHDRESRSYLENQGHSACMVKIRVWAVIIYKYTVPWILIIFRTFLDDVFALN